MSSTFVFYASSEHQYLHSFPTRRSSDLILEELAEEYRGALNWLLKIRRMKVNIVVLLLLIILHQLFLNRFERFGQIYSFLRSEEHTSELQSRGHLVCRLLLEKKKKNSIR